MLSLQVTLVVNNLSANAGDITHLSSVLRSERSPAEGHSNPLQYCYLENPIDREAWWATYSPWGFRVGHD